MPVGLTAAHGMRFAFSLLAVSQALRGRAQPYEIKRENVNQLAQKFSVSLVFRRLQRTLLFFLIGHKLCHV